MGVKGIEANLGKRNPSHGIVNAIGGKHLRAPRRPNKGRKYNGNYHSIVLTRTVSYCFLLLAGPPLAPWRLPLLFVYNTPFYLLLLFIPQCSYLAY